jgi:ABC-type phosphate/phosphonate transport system substrate-binding protein
MIDLRMMAAALCALALAGCENTGTALKTTAGDFAKEAASTATGMVGLKNACTLAGQSEAFCGCLDTELGSKLDTAQVKDLSGVIIDTVRTGSIEAAQTSPAVTPETKDALVKCAARAAVAGAIGEASGQ